MLLKAALNGNRTAKEHPNIPISKEQLVADILDAERLGVRIVHIHPRADDGAESLQKHDIEPVIAAVRKACPLVSVGISTGEWILPDLQSRLRCVSEWKGIADFASVNFSENGAVEVAYKLLELGIGIEAGLFHAEAAETLVKSGLAERCVRIMLEPGEEAIDEALLNIAGIEKVLISHHVQNQSRLLHGFNATAWPLLIEAQGRGY